MSEIKVFPVLASIRYYMLRMKCDQVTLELNNSTVTLNFNSCHPVAICTIVEEGDLFPQGSRKWEFLKIGGYWINIEAYDLPRFISNRYDSLLTYKPDLMTHQIISTLLDDIRNELRNR